MKAWTGSYIDSCLLEQVLQGCYGGVTVVQAWSLSRIYGYYPCKINTATQELHHKDYAQDGHQPRRPAQDGRQPRPNA